MPLVVWEVKPRGPLMLFGREKLRQNCQAALVDLNAHDVEQAAKIIAGTARSMGVEVAP